MGSVESAERAAGFRGAALNFAREIKRGKGKKGRRRRRLKEFLLYYVYSENIPFEGRLFNGVAALCGAFFLVKTFVIYEPRISYAVLFLFIPLIIVWTNKTGDYKHGIAVYICYMSGIALPYLFYMTTGIDSAGMVHLVFGAVLIRKFLKGRFRSVSLFVYFVLIIGYITLDYYAQPVNAVVRYAVRPRMVSNTDVARNIVFLSIMVSLIDVFENKLYRRERGKAEDANRAKSEYIANMSHEIRAPITAIMGMTTIGLGAATTERKDYCFGKVEEASKHLLRILNDVLEIAKIEANKFQLAPEEFCFEEMLQKVVSVIQFRTEEKQIKLSVRVDTRIPSVLFGDDQRLEQVILNLVGNAVKFTPAGGRIYIEAESVGETSEGCALRISVRDTGIGMSPQQQNRIFDAFEQAEAATARKYGGTGLGLRISKNIVELMGGKIEVASELGKGSTFSFAVNLQRGKEEQKIPAIFGAPVSVLLVEDADSFREYHREILNARGAACDTAGSAGDALRLAREKGSYDICLLDWDLPDTDIPKLVGSLKALWAESKTTFVAIASPVIWQIIEDTAKSAGIGSFVPFPVFPSMLGGMLNEYHGIVRQDAANAGEVEADNFAGYTILLAEDIEINREIVLTLLEPTGLRIDCAVNGREAVEKFTEAPERYAAIFMDVNMPEMDGREATRRIRALGKGLRRAREIPIIALTASVFREDINKCIAAGMTGHLGKPLDIDEVLKALRKYLT